MNHALNFDFDNHDRSTKSIKTSFADPSFASNKRSPVHRWVPWIAGFSSDFVRDVVDHAINGHKGVVLDPFAGVGTTLLESAFMGHDVIGYEINPYAVFATNVKLYSHRVNLKDFDATIKNLIVYVSDKVPNSSVHPNTEPPKGFNTRAEFYSPNVLRQVLFILDFIQLEIDNSTIKDLFLLAFASTMVEYSNYSYEPSLGTRKAAGRANINDADVPSIITNKLKVMISDIRWQIENTDIKSADYKVHNESFFSSVFSKTPRNTVDVVVTSPPYLNNYHYIRNTRPHLFWLNFAEKPKDTKILEENNFGKYWQTVRDKERVDLDIPNPPDSLVQTLDHIRTLNTNKGVYGGNGWANYAASYFNDCYKFAQGLTHVLKHNSKAYVVIGNSIIQGIEIPTDIFFGEIAEIVGLEFEDRYIPRATRVGSSIIRSNVRVAAAKKKRPL